MLDGLQRPIVAQLSTVGSGPYNNVEAVNAIIIDGGIYNASLQQCTQQSGENKAYSTPVQDVLRYSTCLPSRLKFKSVLHGRTTAGKMPRSLS